METSVGSTQAYRDVRQLAALPTLVAGSSPPAGQAERAVNGHVPEIIGLVEQLESIDVHELARLTASWADSIGRSANRRSLLLKLSAGLSLAAASPTLADESKHAPSPQFAAIEGDFSGIWHSRYLYPSTGRKGEFVGEHYVVLRQSGNRLIGQSLPHRTGSRLRLELALDIPVATGTWRETTSQNGYYKGAVYHGTLQLVIYPGGRRMCGMWLGFGRDFTINSGQWELVWQDSSTATTAQRAYHLKV
jgi:hypothetical protein